MHISSYKTSNTIRVYNITKKNKTIRVLTKRIGKTVGGLMMVELSCNGKKKRVYVKPRSKRELDFAVAYFVKEHNLL